VLTDWRYTRCIDLYWTTDSDRPPCSASSDAAESWSAVPTQEGWLIARGATKRGRLDGAPISLRTNARVISSMRLRTKRRDAARRPWQARRFDGYPHERRNLATQKFGEEIPHHHRESHSQALRPLGDERLHQAFIAIPEHAGHPVQDNRRRESCAEGCWWRCRMK
jgi:hypothetical protein